MVHFLEYDSPVGKLLLTSDGENITGLWMDREPPAERIRSDVPVLGKAEKWLDDYFCGADREIDFPLDPQGTNFQKKVWEILLTIPCGKTRTYGDIAREMMTILSKEKMSAQAVGQAVGHNPISIFIPCHRVVGAQGKLTGYAGGLDKKIWLLTHEGGAVRNGRVL